uniref:Molybdopterin biosynthesis protein CNX1 n=1 Tax=Rhizophora mucronata TaxID=61149 RepID=A0A2P2K9J0_RHIMU
MLIWARFLPRIFTHPTLCLHQRWLCCYHVVFQICLLAVFFSVFDVLCRVQACLQHPIKTDPVRPEFHCAIIRWNVNDGSRHPRFVAESTGNPLSSWLLSMKSANALLELSTTGSLIPAGTSVTAILISDLIPAAVDASAA